MTTVRPPNNRSGVEPLAEHLAGGLDRPRWDGATLTCFYLLALLIIPARLVVSFIPLTLPPALLIALVLGVLWLGAQLVDTLAVGKGRNAMRTGASLYFAAHLLTYAVATRRFLPEDELTVADSSLVRIMATVAVTIFVCDGLSTRDRLDRVLKVLIGCTTVVAFVGLVQFGLGLDLASYVSVPGLRAQESAYAAFEHRSVFRRPTGTTNHPIEFGLVCAISVPFAVHFVFQARDRGISAAKWWFCLTMVGLGAMMSLSRTAIIGLGIAALVMVITLPGTRKVSVLTIGGTCFVGASAVVPGLFGTLRGMFSNISEDSSVTARTADYAQASLQIDLNPWLGRGFGTYLPTKYSILDNQYLLTLIENGYIGLFALLLTFLCGAYATVRARKLTADPELRGLAACLLSAVLIGAFGAVTFDLLSFGVATGLIFVLLGASGALLRIVRHEASSSPAPGLTNGTR